MTAPRQQQKRRLLLTVAALTLTGVFSPLPAASGEAPPVQVNPHTGLAISGFDPVAYFVEGGPRIGRSSVELSMPGAVWRFESQANRAAFLAHPEVYTPRYRGYDAVAVARGASVPGHPLFWAVVSERLYLFYSADARAAFLADPGRVVDAAERRWPEVERTIAP